ncbi:MAG: Hsp20/alpha crystallin family protein [Phycisphaerales bacterium]
MLTARRNSSCCTPSVPAAAGIASPFDAMFESLLGGFPAVAARAFPAINAWEDENAFHVEAELPGFTIDDIDISLTDNQLTISGERTFDLPADAGYVRRERPSGKFTRVLRVATEIDAANVAATLKNGVLTVTLPKAPAVKPRKISVTQG